MVAFGLALWTTHLSSTISFSRTLSLEPDLTPSISILVGGTAKQTRKQHYYFKSPFLEKFFRKHMVCTNKIPYFFLLFLEWHVACSNYFRFYSWSTIKIWIQLKCFFFANSLHLAKNKRLLWLNNFYSGMTGRMVLKVVSMCSVYFFPFWSYIMCTFD